MKLTIPGKPIAKGRPKIDSRGPFARAVTPQRTETYESKVAVLARQVFETPIDGPVVVDILAYWPMKGTKRKTVPRPAVRKCTNPDADNVAKAILDGLNGIAFLDDAQVARLTVEKWHAAQGDPPRVEVEVRELSEAPPPPEFRDSEL